MQSRGSLYPWARTQPGWCQAPAAPGTEQPPPQPCHPPEAFPGCRNPPRAAVSPHPALLWHRPHHLHLPPTALPRGLRTCGHLPLGQGDTPLPLKPPGARRAPPVPPQPRSHAGLTGDVLPTEIDRPSSTLQHEGDRRDKLQAFEVDLQINK